MRPWRVAVGLTMTAGALAVWGLWVELAYGNCQTSLAAPAKPGGLPRLR